MDPLRTRADQLDMDQRVATFQEVERTYTPEQAQNEAARCLKCPTHWCQKACPAGVPVTDFIALARAGDYEGAYRLIRTASMLPEMCSRVCPQEKQCQSNCTRSINAQAVGIGKLERFVVEQHYKSGRDEVRAPANGKVVAVVGSGPSGLSAAQRLIDLGYAVTVYERDDRAGGLLEYGIPNMKLEKGVVKRKVESLMYQGVVFKTGVNVGVDVTAQELGEEFDAVILAIGSRNARSLNPEGIEDVRGVVSAVDFLTANTQAVLDGDEPIFAQGKQVVIVGGGDTGSDCVGTALRQGAAGITQIEMLPAKTGRQVVYEGRPSREKEGKHDFSQEECKTIFGDPRNYQTTVKAVRGDLDGNLQAITLVSLESNYDEHFRLTMTEVPGSERDIPCQLLIVAAGFLGPEGYVASGFGLETDARSNLVAKDYLASGKVFVCGDCRTGQSLVVKSMVDGRNCADAVDAFLKK
jgi:glutamate synthase (NADPH/NADH) small chain